MANTKVTGDLIAQGTIHSVNLADGSVTATKLHNISTDHISEGSNLFYTDARVSTYLTANNYVTATEIANTANWDEAYSWGDHAGLYSLLGHTHTESEITDFGNYVTGITHDTVNTKLVVTNRDATTVDLSLAQYVDDTNLARLVSGTVNISTGIATFTRDDATTFDVDFSALLDDTNDYVTSASFNTSDGVLTLTRFGGTTVTVNLDNRYLTSAFIEDKGSYTSDLDVLTASVDQGWYSWSSTQPTNSPGWNYGGVLVIRDNSQNLQLALGGSGDNSQRIALRRADSGSYGPWTEFYSTADFSTTDISNWNTAYTYSQVGHLPLTGGTLTGNLNITQRLTMSEDGTYNVAISNGQGGQIWLETEGGGAGQGLAKRFVITGSTPTPYYYWYNGNKGSETVEMEFSPNANLLVYNKLSVGKSTDPSHTLDVNGTLNVQSYIRIDRDDERMIVMEDSGGDDTGYLTMNDSQGNMALMLGVDGNGKHVVSGDGAAKLLYTAHSQNGALSLNAAKTKNAGTTASYSIGLSVNSDDNTIKVGASNDNVGLDLVGGNTVFNANGDLFTNNINDRSGGSITITADTTLDGTTTFNVGRGDVYFENNGNSNANGTGLTLRTSSNPTTGSIFDVRSSGQASRLWVGQSLSSAGTNPFYVGNIDPGDESTVNNYSIELNTNGKITAEGDIVAYGSVSDIRQKENIKPIKSSLDRLNKINGITFNYKTKNPERRTLGVIAQELLKDEVLKLAVFEHEDFKAKDDDPLKNTYGVKYELLTAVLIEAIKELSSEVQELKNKLNGTN